MLVLALMVSIPFGVQAFLVWFPTLASVLLSFTNWDGIGGLRDIEWAGTQNYNDVFNASPNFLPALRNNALWLGCFLVVPPCLGLFFAVLLERELRLSRIYQSVFFTPVVLSLAVIGLISQLIFSANQGLLNNLIAQISEKPSIDWLGDPAINLWAVLAMASWRQTGFIMILYLAGLKGVDQSQLEAARLDGASESQIFRAVTFHELRHVHVIVVVVSVIESLRAFDIVWIISRGATGLELLSLLVTNNLIGEASRIGFGSALATILLAMSLVALVPFMWWSMARRRA